MSTRSGLRYATDIALPMDSQAEIRGDAAVDADLRHPTAPTAEDDQTSRSSQPPTPSGHDWTSIVSALMHENQRFQLQLQQQFQQQIREQEERHQRRQFQDQQQQQRLIELLATRDQERPVIRPKLTRLSEKDDIEAYLVTFERLMSSSRVPPEDWTLHLAPQLAGKAQKAYAALDAETAKNYDAVKESILHRYAITPETYRIRLRKARSDREESLREFRLRLSDLAGKWTANTDRDHLFDIMLMEQLIETMPEDVQRHVRERQPTSSEETAKIGDAFMEARANHKPSSTLNHRCSNCGRSNHATSDCWQRTSLPDSYRESGMTSPRSLDRDRDQSRAPPTPHARAAQLAIAKQRTRIVWSRRPPD